MLLQMTVSPVVLWYPNLYTYPISFNDLLGDTYADCLYWLL